jgi:NACHT domain
MTTSPWSILPSRLELPPQADVAPPVDTRPAELPLASLRWDDFERLCLQLARTRSDVVGARQYGVPGQSQGGIDLFAHLEGPKPYRVYQCKRVDKCEPSVIVDAVDTFLAGNWADRSGELVLCTTDLLRTTQREEAFEEQRKRLTQHGVVLTPWTRAELSDLLRTQPTIVHEFFGQEWVAQFCGAVAAAATASRIAPKDVAEVRGRLHRLYCTVFEILDPGLSTQQDERAPPLHDRYVVHDLIETSADTSTPTTDESSSGRGLTEESRGTRSGLQRQRQRRVSLESEISSGADALRVILGGPGTGKSALLRYLALDLLSDSPRLSGIARVWGRRLPIWIPFGAWVDRLEHDDRSASLTVVVREWLAQWGAGELFPLVERALNDKRLLLLIDGLDEWTSEDAARLAVARLRVFAEQSSVPVVLTSRPQGFQILSAELPGWKVSELAPLSEPQQLGVAERWFKNRHPSESAATGSTLFQRQARDALDALQQIPDATELAEVPLLLSILLLLKSQNVALPGDRFRAYSELTRHLMVIQPQRRAVSAQRVRTRSGLSESDLESAYAYVAFQVHRDHASGVVPVATIRTHLEHVLNDDAFGLAFSVDDSRRIARELIDVGESVSGLLVKRSPGEMGFYHRVIQEHLAAVHLASRAEATQLETISQNATAPQWREVILALTARAPSQEKVEQIIRCVESSMPHDEEHRAEILTEIAAGPALCPIASRTRLLEIACTRIERGWLQSHRRALLETVVSGLARQSVKKNVESRLRRWFPQRVWHRPPILRAIALWPEEEAWELLSLALSNDEEPGHQLCAADTISQRWGGDDGRRGALVGLAMRPYGPTTRSALAKALLDGWPPAEDVRAVLLADGSALSAELQLVRILARLRDGEREESDRDQLLGLLNSRGLHYSWRPAARQALLAAWPNDAAVRDRCIEAVHDRGPSDPARPEIREAWAILLAGYPNDDAVAAALVEELDEKYPRFADVDWSILGTQFRGHPALATRLESWMEDADQFHTPQISGAALVGRTSRGKQILLADLNRGSSMCFWAARGLIEGWGIGDPEVVTVLNQYADGENRRAGWIAHLLPQVITDRARCTSRLLELLADAEVDRPDFVLEGLARLGALEKNDEFARVGLSRIGDQRTFRETAIIGALVRWHPHYDRVRELADRELRHHDGTHAAVAEGFHFDATFRQRISEMAVPLTADLRAVVAEKLLRLGVHDADSVDLCRDFTWERDPEIATTTALALYRGLRIDGAVQDSDIDVLRAELCCYGDRYESRRQAAYVSALELERYELIDEKTEEIVEPNAGPVALRVTLTDVGEPNRPLIRQVLAHWSVLAQRYPDKTLSRFQSRHGAASSDELLPQQAWADIVDELAYGSPVEANVRSLLARISDPLEPALLRFLARREPRSHRLRDACLHILGRLDRTWDYEKRVETAGDILVQQFIDDDAVWLDLESVVEEQRDVPYGAYTTLARARPSSAAVRSKAEGFWRERSGRPAATAFYALCVIGTADELIQQMDRYWGRAEHVGRVLYRPLVERLMRDEPARKELEARILERDSTPARVAMCVPLAESAPLSQNIIELLKRFSAEERRPERPAGFTYDGRTGDVRPIATLLSELIHSSPRNVVRPNYDPGL